MRVMVVIEHDGEHIRPASLSAIRFAQQLSKEGNQANTSLLVLGEGLANVAAEASRFAPVLIADDPTLCHPLADRLAPVVAAVARDSQVDVIVAASSTWAKDVVARAAGLLGGAMASDVVHHHFHGDQLRLVRPMYAGAINATVVLHGEPKIITIRGSSYPAAVPEERAHEVTHVPIEIDKDSNRSEYGQLAQKGGSRPDVTDAKIVVSGGRAFKNTEDFERLVGGLADQLEGATGSSRALVDAGITPNSFQVGQTGKVVAPELYLALGISGAVQHLAGMKNSRVVCAINNDPDAPIFDVSDYGLVGDVYEIVPELIKALQ